MSMTTTSSSTDVKFITADFEPASLEAQVSSERIDSGIAAMADGCFDDDAARATNAHYRGELAALDIPALQFLAASAGR